MAQQKENDQVYHYFDTPDGEDTLKKWWCVMRPTIPAAAGLALADVMLVSHPKGYVATAARLTAVSVPLVGIASAFVLATNGIASLRNKDDRLNWFLGGFVTGTCFGAWGRNRMLGFNMGMLIGILAFVRKEMHLSGSELSPKTLKIRRGGATNCLNDYSLTSERPRNWTTGE